MLGPEVSSEAVVRNAVAPVSTALLPRSVVGLPVTCAMPLPGARFDTLLLLRALRTLVAPLLDTLCLRVLHWSPLLLLGVLGLLVILG